MLNFEKYAMSFGPVSYVNSNKISINIQIWQNPSEALELYLFIYAFIYFWQC
jgi:hypothetical protein